MNNNLSKVVGALALVTMAVIAAAGVNYLVNRDIVYGDTARPDKPLQSLDLYWQDNLERRPVIVYVHDGAWALGDKADVHEKPGFFALHGIVFLSMNYRLRWEASLVDQLEDIVSVIRWIDRNQAQYGLDSTRIILMGHGAGAHLVSLLATQPDYLDTSGVDFTHVRAVVAVDTASYDIGNLMTETGDFLDRRRHRLIFGEQEKAWHAASPINHVKDDKTIPPFALLYTPNETRAGQARGFARALRAANVDVIMIPGNESGTETIDEVLGTAGDAPTLALTAFIRAAI